MFQMDLAILLSIFMKVVFVQWDHIVRQEQVYQNIVLLVHT